VSAPPSLAELLQARLARLPPRTSCFRWLDGERDEATVDLFGEVAVLSLYRPRPPEVELALAEALAGLRPLVAVYLKRRPREARVAAQQRAAEVAPPRPLWGAEVPSLVAQELGVRFEIRPGNGLSVGLYLDARDARAWVRREAAGRRVLNTFAYTCGFGVAAQLGGASRVVNLDLSRKVLDWGEANLALNGGTPSRRDFISGDAVSWARRLQAQGERFELVVLDPPGSYGVGKSRFSAARDYHQLVAALAPLVSPGGLLLAMCNVEALTAEALGAQVRRGLQGRAAREVTRLGASAVDFVQPGALKCLVLELA
jgi:23S rRNA (cytosine1962-C5)-methyltransferase